MYPREKTKLCKCRKYQNIFESPHYDKTPTNLLYYHWAHVYSHFFLAFDRYTLQNKRQ
jgi:hypothetical protein